MKPLQNETSTESPGRLELCPQGLCRGDPRELGPTAGLSRNGASGAARSCAGTSRGWGSCSPAPPQPRLTARGPGHRLLTAQPPGRERPQNYRAQKKSEANAFRPAVTGLGRFPRQPAQVPVTTSPPEPPARLGHPWKAGRHEIQREVGHKQPPPNFF